MSEHTITVEWKRETPEFAYQSYYPGKKVSHPCTY